MCWRGAMGGSKEIAMRRKRLARLFRKLRAMRRSLLGISCCCASAPPRRKRVLRAVRI